MHPAEAKISAQTTQVDAKPKRVRRTVGVPLSDGRSSAQVQMRAYRRELVSHVGGNPSATQKAVIEQAVQIRLRLTTMDEGFAATGAMSEHDAKVYLAWANSYTRLLRQLGLEGRAQKAPSLKEHLAARAAQAAA